jgi:hypothetical protein
MQKGDIVLIKASRGQPGVRRIWQDGAERPFVCLETYWERWQRNQIDPVCWQIERSQVFQFEKALAVSLEEAFAAKVRGDPQAGPRLEAVWAKAKPY